MACRSPFPVVARKQHLPQQQPHKKTTTTPTRSTINQQNQLNLPSSCSTMVETSKRTKAIRDAFAAVGLRKVNESILRKCECHSNRKILDWQHSKSMTTTTTTTTTTMTPVQIVVPSWLPTLPLSDYSSSSICSSVRHQCVHIYCHPSMFLTHPLIANRHTPSVGETLSSVSSLTFPLPKHIRHGHDNDTQHGRG